MHKKQPKPPKTPKESKGRKHHEHHEHHEHHHHKHMCHEKHSPCEGMLGLHGVFLFVLHSGVPKVSKVTGSFTWPVSRKSGASLPLTDIDHGSLQRNGVEIQKLAPAGPIANFTDTDPLTGADVYTVQTLTTDGYISDPSNDATVMIAEADPAASITDLEATVDVAPPSERRALREHIG